MTSFSLSIARLASATSKYKATKSKSAAARAVRFPEDPVESRVDFPVRLLPPGASDDEDEELPAGSESSVEPDRAVYCDCALGAAVDDVLTAPAAAQRTRESRERHPGDEPPASDTVRASNAWGSVPAASTVLTAPGRGRALKRLPRPRASLKTACDAEDCELIVSIRQNQRRELDTLRYTLRTSKRARRALAKQLQEQPRTVLQQPGVTTADVAMYRRVARAAAHVDAALSKHGGYITTLICDEVDLQSLSGAEAAFADASMQFYNASSNNPMETSERDSDGLCASPPIGGGAQLGSLYASVPLVRESRKRRCQNCCHVGRQGKMLGSSLSAETKKAAVSGICESLQEGMTKAPPCAAPARAEETIVTMSRCSEEVSMLHRRQRVALDGSASESAASAASGASTCSFAADSDENIVDLDGTLHFVDTLELCIAPHNAAAAVARGRALAALVAQWL